MPDIWYLPWDDLMELDNANEIFDALEIMEYNESTWNVPGSAEIEEYAWLDMNITYRDVAESTLGWEEDGWDCWVHHFESFAWSELPRHIRNRKYC